MFTNYFLNCFLLILPVLIWNIIFYKALPKGYQAAIFWHGIPPLLRLSETLFRIVIFVLPFLMVLKVKSDLQKTGLVLYLIGIVVYFSVWYFQIYYPDSNWSRSALGFMSPAYTTVLWLLGIGCIGSQSFLGIPHISRIYVVTSVVFVILHTYHSYLVYRNMN